MSKNLFWIAAVALALSTAARPALAQGGDEEAYQAWFLANAEKDTDKAIGLAKEYLDKFPEGQYAGYLKTWYAQSRQAAISTAFNTALKAGDMKGLVRAGREALALQPDDLTYLYYLALNLRKHELFASPPRSTHAAETADFSRRALKLIAAGKVPVGISAEKWNKNANMAWLTQNLAILAMRASKTDEALKLFKQASELDTTNVLNFQFCGRLHKRKYDRAVKAFQALPEELRTAAEPGEEVRAALEQANVEADAAIPYLARFLHLTAGKSISEKTRGWAEATLGALYRYRNPDDPEGWRKLIESGS